MFSFFKKPKKNPLTCRDLQIGQFLELSYKHPSEVGIVDGPTLTCTRLNPEELENRTIQCCVKEAWKSDKIGKWFVSVVTFKKVDKEILQREFLFLEDEVENMRLLK